MQDTQQWRPILSAPLDGRAILIYRPDWDMPLVGLFDAETHRWQQPSGDLLVAAPTFWMALPALPPSVVAHISS